MSIGVIDQASKKIDAINKKIQQLQAPSASLKKALSKFSEVSGITSGFNKIHESAKAAFATIERIAPALGAITTGGFAAGISAMISKWTDFGNSLIITAHSLGLTGSALYQIQNVTRLLGGNAEQATAAWGELQDTLRDASLGKNIDAYRMLTAAHIEWRKEDGTPKDVDAVKWQLMDAINQMGGSPATKRAFGKMFGIVGAEFASALDHGASEYYDAFLKMQALREDTVGADGKKRRSVALNEDEVKGLATAKRTFTEFQIALETLAQRIAIKLTPALSATIKKFQEWALNEDNITKLSRAISTIADGILAASSRMYAIINFFDTLLKSINKNWSALDLLLVYMVGKFTVGMIGSILKISAAFVTWGKGIDEAKIAMEAFNLKCMENPILRTMMLTGKVIDMALPATTQEESDKRWQNVPEDSPLWNGVPAAEKQRLLDQRKTPGFDDRSLLERILPNWLGGRPASETPGPQSSVPSSVAGNKEAFLAAYSAKAEEESKKTGIDPRIILAQAGLETGWGAHAPGNNMFGIKGAGSSQQTSEYINGKMVSTSANFRGYSSPGASFDGYADFINGNPRYSNMRNATGLDSQINELGKSGYATDPNYANKIKSITNGMAPVDGTIKIDVNHNNAPAGSSVVATSSGGYLGTPKVVTPMNGYA